MNNVRQGAGIVIQIYRCPSDPRAPLVVEGSNVPGQLLVTRPSYVAIAGAIDNIDNTGNFRETRITTNSWSPQFGRTAWGGVIVPGFSGITISKIKDGTSNTMVVSEHGARFYWQDTPTSVPTPVGDSEIGSGAVCNGLYRGHDGGGRDPNTGDVREMQNWSDARAQHFTTIRWRINQKNWVRTVPNTGVFSAQDSWKCEGANVPLASEHSGGVNALIGDGSVRFLRESLDLVPLARYATRDDGQVVNVD